MITRIKRLLRSMATSIFKGLSWIQANARFSNNQAGTRAAYVSVSKEIRYPKSMRHVWYYVKEDQLRVRLFDTAFFKESDTIIYIGEV